MKTLTCVLAVVTLWLGFLPTLTWAQGQPFIPPRLTFNYQHPKPDAFLVERSLDSGVTWEQIAKLVGERGRGITWQDTTLAPMTSRLVVQYRIVAQKGSAKAAPSNVASAALGPPAPGECVVHQPEPKVTVSVCTLP